MVGDPGKREGQSVPAMCDLRTKVGMYLVYVGCLKIFISQLCSCVGLRNDQIGNAKKQTNF